MLQSNMDLTPSDVSQGKKANLDSLDEANRASFRGPNLGCPSHLSISELVSLLPSQCRSILRFWKDPNVRQQIALLSGTTESIDLGRVYLASREVVIASYSPATQGAIGFPAGFLERWRVLKLDRTGVALYEKIRGASGEHVGHPPASSTFVPRRFGLHKAILLDLGHLALAEYSYDSMHEALKSGLANCRQPI